jgi:hypothetical protein
LIALLLVALGASAPAAGCAGYAEDLRAMRVADQAVREAADLAEVPKTRETMSPAWQRVDLVDRENTRKLQAWIAKCGWPRRSVQGEEAVWSAWMLAQHADPEFQAQALELVRSAVAAGEESKSDLAYLSDRVRVHAGQPQEYGTQADIKGKCDIRMYPMDDPAKVDERRRELGWPPVDEYRRLMLKTYFHDECDVAPAH